MSAWLLCRRFFDTRRTAGLAAPQPFSPLSLQDSPDSRPSFHTLSLGTWGFLPNSPQETLPHSDDRPAPTSDGENQGCLRNRGHASVGYTEVQGVSIVIPSASITVSATCCYAARGRSPQTPLSSGAEVLWPHSEGDGVADAMIKVIPSTHLSPKEATWLVDAKPLSPSASPQRNA